MLYIHKVSAIRVQEPSGLRTCWQKFPIFIETGSKITGVSKNTRKVYEDLPGDLTAR